MILSCFSVYHMIVSIHELKPSTYESYSLNRIPELDIVIYLLLTSVSFSQIYRKRRMDTRTVFFKRQQKKPFHSRLQLLYHLLYSPRAENLHYTKTQLLSHSGASPLHVTHNSNSLWSLAAPHLPLGAPREPLSTVCSQTEARERKVSMQKLLYGTGEHIWSLALSKVLCFLEHCARSEDVLSDSKSGHLIPCYCEIIVWHFVRALLCDLLREILVWFQVKPQGEGLQVRLKLVLFIFIQLILWCANQQRLFIISLHTSHSSQPLLGFPLF